MGRDDLGPWTTMWNHIITIFRVDRDDNLDRGFDHLICEAYLQTRIPKKL